MDDCIKELVKKDGTILKRYIEPSKIILKHQKKHVEISRGRSEKIVEDYWAENIDFEYIELKRKLSKTTLNNIFFILQLYDVDYVTWYSFGLSSIDLKSGDIKKLDKDLLSLLQNIK